jgi:anti-sigma factor RsiW
MTSPRLTCRDCASFLADYVAGELPAEVRASFELHLDRCRNCRAYVEQYAAVIAAGKRACQEEDEAAAHQIPEELVQAILNARLQRPPDAD